MSLQSTHQHRMERRGSQFFSDGALKSTEVFANKAQAEAVVCDRCGKQVHPSNWMKHQNSDHGDDPKPLHESQKDDHLALAAIRIDGGTQPRAAINDETVTEYAEAMNDGAKFPAIVVFFDGKEYWLADGFHRVNAAKKLAWLDLPADVHQGTQRDAILFSVGVNATHGLRRTNADKHRAVERLLRDEEWSKWSNYEIAQRCAVSESFVRKLRPHYAQNVVTKVTYTTKHGTPATMQTGNIGKSNAKADEQAAQVFESSTKSAPIRYGKLEDDYVDDVPSTDADEPDWLDDAESHGFKVGDTVNDAAGHGDGEIIELDPQMGALVKFPNHTPWWLKTDTLVPVKRKADAAEKIEFGIGDFVSTTFGRTDGKVWNRNQTMPDGETVYVKFPGGNAFWIKPEDLVLDKRAEYAATEPVQPVSATEPAASFAHHLSGSNEWYTPAQYVDAARELMAGITLDPASCALANQTVKATTYYDIDSDGLSKPWKGSVFLNPPYGWDGNGENNATQWIGKLISEYTLKHIDEAVLLVNATTERKWFQPLWRFPICFTDHRINFYNAEGEQKQPTLGNAFVYLGQHIRSFNELFKQFGAVVQRTSQ